VTERATAPTPAAASGLTRAAVEAHSARLSEPAWLRELRLAAWAAYERLPLPSVTHAEAWRRTNISGLPLDAFGPSDGGRALAPVPSAIDGHVAERAGLLVHSDGAPATAVNTDAGSARGVIFSDLSAAIGSHPDLVREHLMSTVGDWETHKLRALHVALWSAGTFVFVPAGVEVALPLVARRWVGTGGAAVLPHTLLVAGEGSKVTLVDQYGSAAGGARTMACGATELILQAGAQVRYVAFQDWGAPTWEVGSLIRAHLHRDATLHSLVVALGGALVKADVESLLLGPGASSEMLGIYFGAGEQHLDFHTLQEHRAPHTHSDLLYKGAVKDRARAVFAGLIRVDWGAQKTNAFQANRNLILSPGARSDSIPKLEIMANDLRCTHGSATSRLNEEHIFYLMSRGLTREQATFMIVEGFFADVLDRIPLERVRAHLQQRIAEKMAA
jgi:Fe-S cluster assembly protein SufD